MGSSWSYWYEGYVRLKNIWQVKPYKLIQSKLLLLTYKETTQTTAAINQLSRKWAFVTVKTPFWTIQLLSVCLGVTFINACSSSLPHRCTPWEARGESVQYVPAPGFALIHLQPLQAFERRSHREWKSSLSTTLKNVFKFPTQQVNSLNGDVITQI